MKNLLIVFLLICSVVACGQDTIENGMRGSVVRGIINDNFIEIYAKNDTVNFRVDSLQLTYFRTSLLSDTIDLTDNNKMVLMNVGTANTLTVVANSIKAFPTGSRVTVVSTGVGQTTITAGAGVTINSADSKTKIRVQFSPAMLTKTGTDTWLLTGDLSL